jgi:hypothetical protein
MEKAAAFHYNRLCRHTDGLEAARSLARDDPFLKSLHLDLLQFVFGNFTMTSHIIDSYILISKSKTRELSSWPMAPLLSRGLLLRTIPVTKLMHEREPVRAYT